MSETEEFAEALLAQLSVEINEEKEIDSLSKKIKEDNEFKVEFGDTEKIAKTLFSSMFLISFSGSISSFTPKSPSLIYCANYL